jgi:hypothetical protein
VKTAGVRKIFGCSEELSSAAQAADVLVDDGLDDVLLPDDEFPDESEDAPPLSEDLPSDGLLSELPLLAGAGAVLDDEPRLSVR